jgi:hypothetical protein
MAERNGQAITFRGWEGGEYGVLDPGVAGRAEKQMFTGSNVLRYRSGLLGPRPGLREIAFTSPPTGLPRGGNSYFDAGGGVTFFQILQNSASNFEIYKYNATAGTVSAALTWTSPASIPFNILPFGAGAIAYMGLPGNGLYEIDFTANTVTLIDADPDGGVIDSTGVRLLASEGDVLWYSDANDWATFQATSFLQLAGFIITFLAHFRDGVIVGTGGGVFHMITGVFGATTTVRELSRGGGPSTSFHATRVADDKVWYWNSNERYPSMFNGALHTRYDYLDFPNPASDSVYEGEFPSRLIVPADWMGTNDWVTYGFDESCIFANDVMTRHILDLPYQVASAFGGGGTHIISVPETAGLSTSGTPKFYYFSPGFYDRPAFTTDDWGQPGDGTDDVLYAYFMTPEWWEDGGHEVRVNQVIVDYTGWDTGATVDEVGFEVYVKALHRAGAVAATSVGPLAVSDSQTLFSASGTTRRAAVNVPPQSGGGFQVVIDNIQNCAIKSITAVLSNQSRRA